MQFLNTSLLIALIIVKVVVDFFSLLIYNYTNTRNYTVYNIQTRDIYLILIELL